MDGTSRRVRPGAVVVVLLLIAAALSLVTGALPPSDALSLAGRVTPVLGFVVAITIVAELARDAAVFDIIAQALGRWGRGRVLVLWGCVVLLAVTSTVFLSLDTTAVIVTPVVVLLARGVGVPPLPFALATVWLANTASLLLPVSNLTNLLAAPAIGDSPAAFLALSWAPALAGIIVPVLVLTVWHRRSLFGTYPPPRRSTPGDPVLFWIAAGVLAVLLPLLALVRDVWIPAAAAAVVLGAVFLIRRRQALRLSLVPWQALGLALALFVLVETVHVRGLSAAVDALAAGGHGVGDVLQVAAIGAFGANAINNLPAYLVLEPMASGDPVLLMALLIGVNLGPLITPWASLATLLWHHRVVGLGVPISWGRYMLWGLLVTVPTVAAAAVALALVAR